MSKFSDRLLAEVLFRKEPKEKVKKVKEFSFKDAVKFQREVEEYLEWKKSKEKKEEKKPDTWWKKLSVWQQLSILMVTVPLALMAETLLLLQFAASIARVFHQ